VLDICRTRAESGSRAAVHRENQGEKLGSSTLKGGHMATEKSKTEKSAKKLQIKDLTGKELDKQVIERVKGGAPPKIICYSSTAKTMPW
jgi:hypothetical protein